MEAAHYDRRILIERGLEKPHEIEVSVLGNDQPQVSVPGEVIPSDEFYSYRAKYIDNLSKLVIPAGLPEQISEEIRQIALRIYKVVDCSGMARVDFLVDRNDNSIYVSEINTIPGFTQISMYPKLWEASGLSYPALVDRLVELALERKQDRDRTVRKYGGKNEPGRKSSPLALRTGAPTALTTAQPGKGKPGGLPGPCRVSDAINSRSRGADWYPSCPAS